MVNRQRFSARSREAQRVLNNPTAMLGLGLVLFVALVALLAPYLIRYPVERIHPLAAMQGPSAQHWMGTDSFGRDIYSRVLMGSRLSLGVAISAVLLGGFIGSLLGLVAGYVGGWVDDAISRMVDILLAFPGVLLAFAIVAVLGTGLGNLTLAIGIAMIPHFTRLIRGSVMQVRDQDFVTAAHAVGAGHGLIMFKHILPNIAGPVVVFATMRLGIAILSATSLSYLGMGASPPSPEWGLMLSEGRGFIRAAWWWSAFPGMAIMLTIVAVNLLGDGLMDALDPRGR